jgi:hypothetical protein
MNPNLTTDTTSLELAIKLTSTEANSFRDALTASASEAESKRAATLLIGSLRSRRARYLIRRLGADAAI